MWLSIGGETSLLSMVKTSAIYYSLPEKVLGKQVFLTLPGQEKVL